MTERWKAALENLTVIGDDVDSLQKLLSEEEVFVDEETYSCASIVSEQARTIKSAGIMEPQVPDMVQKVETTVAFCGATSVPEIDHTVKTYIDIMYHAVMDVVSAQLSQLESRIHNKESSMDKKLQHFEKTLCEVQRGMETCQDRLELLNAKLCMSQLQLLQSQSQAKPPTDGTPAVPTYSPPQKKIRTCPAQPYSSHVPNPHTQQPPCRVFPPPPSSFQGPPPSHISSGPGFGRRAGPLPPSSGPGGIATNSPFPSTSGPRIWHGYQNLPTANLLPGETPVRPSSGSRNRSPTDTLKIGDSSLLARLLKERVSDRMMGLQTENDQMAHLINKKFDEPMNDDADGA